MDIIKNVIDEAPYIKDAQIERSKDMVVISRPVLPVSGLRVSNVKLFFHQDVKDNYMLLFALDEDDNEFQITITFDQTYGFDRVLYERPFMEFDIVHFKAYLGYASLFQSVELNYLLIIVNYALDIQSQSFSTESLFLLQTAYKKLQSIYKDEFRFQEMFVKLQTIFKQKLTDKKIERIDTMIQELQTRFSKLIQKNTKMDSIASTFTNDEILSLTFPLLEDISKIEDLIYITYQLIRIRKVYKNENKYASLSSLSRRQYLEDIFILAIKDKNKDIFMKLLPTVSPKLTMHHLEFIYKEILFIEDDDRFSQYEFFIESLVENVLIFRALLYMATTHVFGHHDEKEYHYSYIGWCIALEKFDRLTFMFKLGVPMNFHVLRVYSNESKKVYRIPFLNYLIMNSDITFLKTFLKTINPFLELIDLESDQIYYEKFAKPITIPGYIIKDEASLLGVVFSSPIVLLMKKYYVEGIEIATTITPQMYLLIEALNQALFMICRQEHPLSDKTQIYLHQTTKAKIIYNSDDTPDLSNNLTDSTAQTVSIFIHQLIREEAENEVDYSYHRYSTCLKLLCHIINEIEFTSHLVDLAQKYFMKIINELGEHTNVVFNLSLMMSILIKETRSDEDMAQLQSQNEIVSSKSGIRFFGIEYLQPTTDNVPSTLSK